MTERDYMGYKVDPESGIVYGKLGRPFCTPAARGYIEVHNGSSGFNMRAHRMIWEVVHGEIPKGLEVNHKNGVKTDNRIKNLELVTSSENTLHAYSIGLLSKAGEKNGRARLSAADVMEIRSSTSPNGLAGRYGVSDRHIRKIRNGDRWKVAA